jgi:putative transposase
LPGDGTSARVRESGWRGFPRRCDPLTVNDVFSRASLVCHAMVAPKSADVRHRLERAFGVYGLPRFMLSYSGPPFGSNGLGRLSRLGVWLVRLGVIPVLTEPGRPDQNGRHERFHETLKAETASPPSGSIRAQQASFRRFQESYNDERPHEALAMKTPAEVYELSSRQLPASLHDHAYPDGFDARHVRPDGSIKWDGAMVFVGEAYAGEVVGMKTFDDGLASVHLGPLKLGVLHARSRTIVPLEGGVTHVPGHGAA